MSKESTMRKVHEKGVLCCVVLCCVVLCCVVLCCVWGSVVYIDVV